MNCVSCKLDLLVTALSGGLIMERYVESFQVTTSNFTGTYIYKPHVSALVSPFMLTVYAQYAVSYRWNSSKKHLDGGRPSF